MVYEYIPSGRRKVGLPKIRCRVLKTYGDRTSHKLVYKLMLTIATL